MPKLHITLLDQAIIDQILDESVQLLADPGIQVHNAEALELLTSHGAQLDRQTDNVLIPAHMIEAALQTVPQAFTLYDTTGAPAVQYGSDQVHFDPGSAAVSLLTDPSGKQRTPVTADYVRFTQLVEMLPQFDAQSTAFVCQDVAEEIGDLYRLYLALNFMRKPIITGAFRKDTWWSMLEMLCAIRGGQNELAAQPLAVFDVCPTPPLLWSDLTCQNLIDCARQKVPAQLVSMPLAGVTAPVTLLAAVVEHAAENLSGVVISQLAQHGAPLVWGGAPAAFDMRHGSTPMGDVNTWLIDLATIETGKALGLPTHTYMGSSDAKQIDVQAGLESATGTLLAALSGANMVSGAGMLDFLRCQSFEKLVIDAEIIGMAKRLVAGVEAPQQPLALDLMRAADHKANFLSHPHTHRWFRRELHIPSALIDRASYETWYTSGGQSAYQRATLQVEQLLAKYTPPDLEDGLRRELRQIASREGQRFGMDRLPPLPV